MHLSRVITLTLGAAAGLIVVACTPNTHPPTKDVDGQGSFYVESVKGSAEVGDLPRSTSWRVPTSITMHLEVCLRDRTSRRELVNQKLYIAAPGSSVGQDVHTNVSGCFPYEEPLDFNYFAGQSGWVSVKREIIGRDVNEGRRTIELAVNPWAVGDRKRDSAKAVVFMRDGDSGFRPTRIFGGEASVHQFLAGDHDAQGAARLVIQDLNFKSIPESESIGHVGSRYMIEMKPKIWTRTYNGQDNYDPVKDGDFDIEMQLLAVNTGAGLNQTALVLDPNLKAKSVAHVRDNQMRTEIMIDQPLKPNQGNLELAIRITPRTGTHATIEPFSSVYRLGTGTTSDSGSGWESVNCETANSCDFDHVVRSAVNYGQSADHFVATNDYFKPNDRYTLSNMKLGFFMVKPGETATQRTIMYTASTCLNDLYNGNAPLANTPMTIRYIKQKKISPEEKKAMEDRGETVPEDQHDEIEKDVITKRTDDKGCLNWDGLVFHKYYKPEQYFERTVEIEKGSGWSQRISFVLNPWDTNIYFGRDKREFTSEKTLQEIEKRKKVISRFFVGGYSYHTVRFLYNIDPFMELEVKKTVLLEVVPQVLRYSGIKDARKMTEHLRDGIYLMKLGIEKSYLDPRDNAGMLLRQTAPDLQSKIERIGPEQLSSKEFVTTNMSLVRVVDGMIIFPVELTMRDLRLMRVRSNFLIELQTVDERLIQAYHKFKDYAIDKTQLAQALDNFHERLKETPALEDVKPDAAPGAPKNLVELRDKRSHMTDEDMLADMDHRAEEAKTLISAGVNFLSQQLTNGGALGTYLNPGGQSTNVPFPIGPNTSINNNFELTPDLLTNLKAALAFNDFSELQLPKSDEIDLNLFVENDSGLDPRTFVGPVIFLSNAYSDSVRATDNLDEEKCKDDKHHLDKLAEVKQLLAEHKYTEKMRTLSVANATLNAIESEQSKSDAIALNNKRQNNAYQFNRYFGSLSHLCYKSVDWLMEREKELRVHQADLLVASSLKHNFINSFGFDMDFVSLTNEPLLKIADNCTKDIAKCLVETKEKAIPVESIGDWINRGLKQTKINVGLVAGNFLKYFTPGQRAPEHGEWKREDYRDLFYHRNSETAVALCNMLSNRIAGKLVAAGVTEASEDVMRSWVLNACTMPAGLLHDIKYHVERTGDYTFLGGLNLNINVGDSFSMGWSNSYSSGTELTDFIGAFAKWNLLGLLASTNPVTAGVLGVLGEKVIAPLALKPFSFKTGESMSGSQGTSISRSTYLVSQLAKFDVDLNGYEKCAVVRLSDQGYRWFKQNWTYEWRNIKLNPGYVFGEPQHPDAAVDKIVRGGLMVCEGDTRRENPKLTVEEMYFYFTQHFTEGDMLDQADLYNHPWLLAMRGMRDFNVFVSKIRAQQEVGYTNFALGKFNFGRERPEAWALEHMSQVYAQVLPSFPGYYTVLDKAAGEDITAFLLQQSRKNGNGEISLDPNSQIRLEKNGATDPNAEVTHPTVGARSAIDNGEVR